MPRKRKPGGYRPLWAPMPVDVKVEDVNPLPGWLLLEEVFPSQEHMVEGTDISLTIWKPYESNTVFGKILKIHDDTSKDLGVDVGDTIVYREYSGGRWAFNGVKTLLTPAKDILAQVQ